MANKTFVDRMFRDEIKSQKADIEKRRKERKEKLEKAKAHKTLNTEKVSFCFKFLVPQDNNVIKKLQSVENKTDYIRKLIEKDLWE